MLLNAIVLAACTRHMIILLGTGEIGTLMRDDGIVFTVGTLTTVKKVGERVWSDSVFSKN